MEKSMENYDLKFNYLDLLKNPLDPIQKQSCCANGNTVVAAGAGSGKTQVLATRFAWLVMSKNVPAREILTLTFTKKAAGEMYQRIYQILSFFANNPNTPELERKRAFAALEDFSEVHIQTLDSYCSGIVKQAANQYGIRPDFNSGTAEASEEIKKLALPFVFSHKNNPAIKAFVKPGNYQAFADEILSETIEKNTSLISPDNFFTERLALQKAKICQLWNYLICAQGSVPSELQDILSTLEQNAYDKDTVFISSLKEALKQTDVLVDNADKSDKFTFSFLPLAEALHNYSDLGETILAGNDDFSSDRIQNAGRKILEIIKLWNVKHNAGARKHELKAFSKYMKDDFLPVIGSLANYLLEYDQIQALFDLMGEFLKKVNQAKRISGNLTFSDISELALKILSENEDIRIQEQNSFSQIMIDEFQDNNRKNRDLLFLICGDKEKLFFVGDEKQSIYKFRGADVSVFNHLKELPNISEAVPMTYNYRSTLEMITAFNLMFGQQISVFNNSTKENYEAKYLTMAYKYDPEKKKIMEFPTLTQDTVPIHVNLLNTNLIDKTHLGSKDQLAYFIAKTIHDILEKDKSLSPSDFAILDKSRTDRKYITKWLNYFNINYDQDQNNSLFADGPVNDIYNYLKLCVYPSDLNARAAYLASPFCSQDVNEIMNDISRGKEFHIKDQQQILSQSLCKTIEELWIKQGYYYETILNKNTAQFASEFDMLFELARQCDKLGKNISWFVDQLSIIKNNESGFDSDAQEINTAELTFPLEKEDSVQLMTIHKSKGLQFKIVFMYGCINMNKKSDSSNFFFDEELGATFSTSKSSNIFFLMQKDLADKKEIAEVRRLLYVGVTRAIQKLYIVGAWNQKESDSDIRLLERMIHYHYPQLVANPDIFVESLPYNTEAPFDYRGIEPVTKTEAYKNVDFSERGKIIDLEKVYEKYQEEASIILTTPVSNRKTPSSLELNYTSEKAWDQDSGEKLEQASDVLNNASFTAADFGTLVHAYLEANANGIAPQDFVPEPKLLKNLSEKDRKENCNLCIKMTNEFNAHEIGKKLMEAKKANRFYKAEWAFRMFYDNAIFTGSMDLIFQNEDGTYIIVDYKSDGEINCEKYAGQQTCYRHAAAKLLGVSEDKINCYLYFLKFQELRNAFEN